MARQDGCSLKWTSCSASLSNTGLLFFLCHERAVPLFSPLNLQSPGERGVKGMKNCLMPDRGISSSRMKRQLWAFMWAKGKQKSQSQSCFASPICELCFSSTEMPRISGQHLMLIFPGFSSELDAWLEEKTGLDNVTRGLGLILHTNSCCFCWDRWDERITAVSEWAESLIGM